MQSGKSPGSDSFPVEFYTHFWGHDLSEILNFSFHEGTLSDSQCQGFLHLLYKKDDLLLLKFWHLISLLNIDYKIVTKALLNCLHKILPLILSEDQTCGVPDHCIFENLFLMHDTIDYVQEKDLSAATVSLGQENSFDRVNHCFLQEVLKCFNFGPDFRRWVRTIYTDISSQVVNNNWLSLCCLVVETLRQANQHDPSIEGIGIPGLLNKQSSVSVCRGYYTYSS